MTEKCNIRRPQLYMSPARSPHTPMRTTHTNKPSIIHAVPGRMRVHMPGWSEQQQHSIERRLRRIPGVSSAQANPLTSNILIRFDSTVTTETILLAATHSVSSQCAATREQDTPALAQQRNDFQIPVSHATACAIEPQPPVTRLTPECPAQKPMGNILLSPTAQPMPMQPLVHLNPSHAHPLNTTPPEWLSQPDVAHAVVRTQMLRTTGNPVEVRYPHVVPAISRPVGRRAARHAAPVRTSRPGLPETTTIQTRHSSIPRRILRALLAPGVAAFVLKATSVILGLARASSPLGLVLGGIEIVQLFAEAHERWFAFTPAASYRIDRLCMQCQAAF